MITSGQTQDKQNRSFTRDQARRVALPPARLVGGC